MLLASCDLIDDFEFVERLEGSGHLKIVIAESATQSPEWNLRWLFEGAATIGSSAGFATGQRNHVIGCADDC